MDKINVFMIDPPWPKKKGGLRAARPRQGHYLDYKTMPVSGIFDLLDKQIFPLAACPHSVFLWSIDEFLRESEEKMESRGYRRHARMIWDKCNGVAPAFTVRYAHEYLVWFYKPKMPPIAVAARGKFTTVLREPATGHSRKPSAAYKMIDALYPDGERMDVFARRPYGNWKQFGDEAESQYDYWSEQNDETMQKNMD
jgi:N6-adenosine-specific RNA methylase IME4